MVAELQRTALDELRLSGMQINTKLGVAAWEYQHPQIVIVDLVLGIDNQAKKTDELKDTVDYAALSNQLIQRYRLLHFRLLEALAEDMAQFILTHFAVEKVTLHLTKQGILPMVREVSIAIERQKGGSKSV